MGVWSSDAYEGPDRPLASRRGKRTSLSEDLSDAAMALGGLFDMGASTVRGGAKAALGAPGDIEELIRKMSGGAVKDDTVLPTTTNMGQLLPPVREGQKESPYEGVGEVLNPITPAKKAIVAGAGLEHLLPLAQAAGTATPAALKASLYAGALRKDLLASHSTTTGKLLKNDDLPKELYNLSMGITSDKPMSFGGGNVTLIPKEGMFDPATSPSTLHPFDSYSPRASQAGGMRQDDLLRAARQLKSGQFGMSYNKPGTSEYDYAQDLVREAEAKLKEQRGARLVDRLGHTYPKGGQRQEGIIDKGAIAPTLPTYGKGGYEKELGQKFEAGEIPETLQDLSYGHRSPSFAAYERSPYGGDRLLGGERSSNVYRDIEKNLHADVDKVEALTGHRLNNLIDVAEDPQAVKALRSLASAKPGDPNFDPHLTAQAQEWIKRLRKTKTDYAELKAWGPVGLHSDNFAGIIADSWRIDGNEFKALQEGAERRGLNFMALPHDDSNKAMSQVIFETAKKMQANPAQRKVQVPGANIGAQVLKQAKSPLSKALSSQQTMGVTKILNTTELDNAMKALKNGSISNQEMINLAASHPNGPANFSLAQKQQLLMLEIMDHTNGKKKYFEDLNEEELENFLDMGKDHGIDPDHWHEKPKFGQGAAHQANAAWLAKHEPASAVAKVVATAKEVAGNNKLIAESAKAMGLHPLTLDAAVMADKKGENLSFAQKKMVAKHNEFIQSKNVSFVDVPKDVVEGAKKLGLVPSDLHKALNKHDKDEDLSAKELDMVMDYLDLK